MLKSYFEWTSTSKHKLKTMLWKKLESPHTELAYLAIHSFNALCSLFYCCILHKTKPLRVAWDSISYHPCWKHKTIVFQVHFEDIITKYKSIIYSCIKLSRRGRKKPWTTSPNFENSSRSFSVVVRLLSPKRKIH